ncbi:MAG TPA: hypothetical protein PK413_11370, partial [Thermoanaerobaculia bacterium]|nr:hypothetical protein [Thermoanaerobaculia bacterium]
MPSLACRRPAVAGTCLFLALAALGVPVQAAADPASLLEEIRQSSLDVEGARQLGKVSFAAGPLTLSIEQGLLFPASRVGGHVVEMVFLGTGTVRLQAPDSVE